jgi:uncharacterized protein
MAGPNPNLPRVPSFDVRISGESYGMAFQGNLRGLTVADDLTLPAMFEIDLVGSVDEPHALPWLDNDPKVTLGAQVEILFGWHDALNRVMTGDIAAIEPEFGTGRMPSMRLRGYDSRQRLQRGPRTRTFQQASDSEIATQIGRDAGLSVDARDSGQVHDYVLQANQTDMAFLLHRAAGIGFELLLREGTLLFRPAAFDAGEALTLSVDDDLIVFSASCSVAQQPRSLEVRGWDVRNKAVLRGVAEAGAERGVMGSRASAAWADRVLGAAADWHDGRDPAPTQADADALARARFNEASLALVTAEGLLLGRADLRAGTVVKIVGAGTRFAGAYYVRSVEHRYTPAGGYTTRFSGQRNAL